MKQQKPSEGWGWPAASRKAHYFVAGRSLCRGWAFTGLVSLFQGNDASLDNCKECQKALAKRLAGEKR